MDTRLTKILLILVFLLSPVSAKFICGEVIPTDETSPSWYSATTYLLSNNIKQTSCQISPSNNRYCCELDEEKMAYNWKIGDLFETKITDISSGYFASPTSINLTSQGYDIAPNLTLEKAITITQPNTTLIVSKNPIQIQSKISTNCQAQKNSTNQTSSGKNIISISAICNDETFTEKKTIYQVENIEFKKVYSEEFRGNSNNPKIKNKKTATITLQTTLSNEVENIQLKEYVPSSWEVSNISGNGVLSPSTPDYNLIIWQVSGKNLEVSYEIKSPSVGIVPRNFAFKTFLDYYNLDETKIQVYKIIPLPTIEEIVNEGGWVYSPETYSKVSEIFPIIFQDSELTAALYSSKPIERGAFDLKEINSEEHFERKFIHLKSYQIQTNLNETEFGKFAIEYETNQTFLEENNYKRITFFIKDLNNIYEINNITASNKEGKIKYKFESEKSPEQIMIFAEKNTLTLWDKIINLWYKIRY